MKKKPGGIVIRKTLNGPEISDILTAHVIKKEAPRSAGNGLFVTDMTTTTTQEQVFIELKIEELERPNE